MVSAHVCSTDQSTENFTANNQVFLLILSQAIDLFGDEDTIGVCLFFSVYYFDILQQFKSKTFQESEVSLI